MLIVLKWNIYALVGSNIVFSVCMCFLNARAIHKASGYKQEMDRTFVKPLISAVIMGIFTYASHLLFSLALPGRIATLLSVLVAVVVYALCILKLGTLTEQDIKDLPQGYKILRLCRRFNLLPHKES